MDSNKILEADVLDIIFDGRNKEYGAYDLRRTYNRRVVKALGVTASVILLLCSGYYLSAKEGQVRMVETGGDVIISEVTRDLPPVKPPPLPPPKQVPRIAMKIFVTPRIVIDEDVKPEDKIAEQKDLDDVRIGAANVEGLKDDGTPTPSASEGKGITEAPAKKDEMDYGAIFTKVEIESEYPGGVEAWKRYLNKNFQYPGDAVNIEVQGTVVVQFIVDKEGNVSEVTAVSGPESGGLRAEAVRVISKSGKWVPAIQNGRQVRSYRRQPIVFRMDQP